MLSYGNKLWQVDRPKENRRGSFSYYRFTEDGKWLVYRKNRGEKGYWQPDMGDIELIQSWQLLNDSVMNVGGMNYKILTLSDAALAYADPGGNDTLKFFFKGDKLP